MVEELKTSLHEYKALVEVLQQENVELLNQNAKLNHKICNIEYRFDSEEQTKLNHNVVINGVPENENENLCEIAIKISDALQVKVDPVDIKIVKRTAIVSENSGLPRSIIVVFNDKQKRDEVLKNNKIQKKKKNEIDTSILKLNQNEEARTIYIAEQLTMKKQYLYKVARDIRREKCIKFAWVSEGDIFIRKYENSKIIKIKNIEQIIQFKNANRDE